MCNLVSSFSVAVMVTLLLELFLVSVVFLDSTRTIYFSTSISDPFADNNRTKFELMLISIYMLASKWVSWTLYKLIYMWLNIYLRPICRQYWSWSWTNVYLQSISWYIIGFHGHSMKGFIYGWIYISNPFADNTGAAFAYIILNSGDIFIGRRRLMHY